MLNQGCLQPPKPLLCSQISFQAPLILNDGLLEYAQEIIQDVLEGKLECSILIFLQGSWKVRIDYRGDPSALDIRAGQTIEQRTEDRVPFELPLLNLGAEAYMAYPYQETFFFGKESSHPRVIVKHEIMVADNGFSTLGAERIDSDIIQLLELEDISINSLSKVPILKNTGAPIFPIRLFEPFERQYDDIRQIRSVIDEDEELICFQISSEWTIPRRGRRRQRSH